MNYTKPGLYDKLHEQFINRNDASKVETVSANISLVNMAGGNHH